MDINSVNHLSAEISQQETYIKKGNTEAYSKKTEASFSISSSVVYEQGDDQVLLTDSGYKVDMDKIHAMKEESEQRMVDLFRETVKGGTLKQIGGLRGYINLLRGAFGEEQVSQLESTIEVTIEITEETINKAKEETAEDGYWGAEATSDRFLDFAKALSGGDPEKADMLLDAVKEGFKAAEELWGSELPELSQNTLARTIEKFEAWRDGTEEDTVLEIDD